MVADFQPVSYLKPGNERRIDDCSYVEFILPSSIINNNNSLYS